MDDTPTTVMCDCDDWKVGDSQISSMMMMAWTHGMSYTAKIWVYCPWCGKRLYGTPLETKQKEEQNDSRR